ncbi:MAG: low molecular weight phosphotyrosine protein phosphatase [Clostridia bacterium]|nr:low molecular weight phosphotyrosine protein phosphatase [Clostridia bacterium]
MIKIMFVCHGNICRSPMAEFVMRDMIEKDGLSSQITVASSATSREEIGNDIHHGTRKILEKHHIPFARRQAVQITRADYDSYDYIIAMDAWNARNLSRIIGEDTLHKVSLLMDFAGGGEVADPWYTGDFDVTYRDVSAGCLGLINHIKKTI